MSLPASPVQDAAGAPSQAAREASVDWTILVYAAVDNDWERPFMRDIRRMRKGLVGLEGVEVLLLIDRSPRYSKDSRALGEDFDDTRLYRLTGGEVERVGGGEHLSGLLADGTVELDMGDPQTLQGLIRLGKERWPSRHQAVFIVSHGEGMAMCPDETDESILFTAELSETLGEADSMDLLGIDACLMAAVENAYEWRPGPDRFGADFLVAAAPVSSSWPYQEIFEAMGARTEGSLSPAGLAELIVEQLRQQIAEGRSGDTGLERDLQSWCALDLSRAAEAKRRLDTLAHQLWLDEEKQDLLELRGSGLEAETFVYVWPESGAEAEMPFVDLTHLCDRIAGSESFGSEARALARHSAEAASELVLSSFGFDHYSGFEAGRHGAHLVFPDGDRTDRRGRTYFERVHWYSALAVEGREMAYGRYAWCADDSIPGNSQVETWFELMDAWFDTVESDPVGRNGYAW